MTAWKYAMVSYPANPDQQYLYANVFDLDIAVGDIVSVHVAGRGVIAAAIRVVGNQRIDLDSNYRGPLKSIVEIIRPHARPSTAPVDRSRPGRDQSVVTVEYHLSERARTRRAFCPYPVQVGDTATVDVGTGVLRSGVVVMREDLTGDLAELLAVEPAFVTEVVRVTAGPERCWVYDVRISPTEIIVCRLLDGSDSLRTGQRVAFRSSGLLFEGPIVSMRSVLQNRTLGMPIIETVEAINRTRVSVPIVTIPINLDALSRTFVDGRPVGLPQSLITVADVLLDAASARHVVRAIVVGQSRIDGGTRVQLSSGRTGVLQRTLTVPMNETHHMPTIVAVESRADPPMHPNARCSAPIKKNGVRPVEQTKRKRRFKL